MITLAIGGTVSTGAVSLTRLAQDTALTSTANDLVAHINLARSEAITRHVDTIVCPSKNATTCAAPNASDTRWEKGWLVYVDENGNREPEPREVVRVHADAGTGIAIKSSRYRDQIVYQPLGTAGGSTITLAICSTRGPNNARYVTISNTGRARISRTTTSTMRCS